MITQPSIAQLLTSMKIELTEKIIPALSDPTLVVNVQMMTAILGALAVRVEHELAWMRNESARIETAAEHVLAARPDAVDVAHALADYRSSRTDSLLLSAAQSDYDRAGELLSRLTEAAYASGDNTLIRMAQQLFEDRLATEQAAVGSFVAVGRA